MMGRQVTALQLLYHFRLHDHVPDDHFLLHTRAVVGYGPDVLGFEWRLRSDDPAVIPGREVGISDTDA
jgi:hypothetical protein